MLKVSVKRDNIDKYAKVYVVLMYSEDKDLIKQYRLYSGEDTVCYL